GWAGASAVGCAAWAGQDRERPVLRGRRARYLGLARHPGPCHRGAALMAIRGSLREASFADVLQLLAMGRKSGCLSVTNRGRFGQIFFEDGRITYATIVNRRDRLGDILVRSGVLTAEELHTAVAAQDDLRDVRLGEILVGRGLITREQLQRHVRTQIEEAVYHLFTWSEGTFNFEPDIYPDDQDLLVSISPESLLLEGARRVDEWTQIVQKVPSFDTIFSLDR